MHLPDEGVFERGSRVHEYWLAHCEGFAIRRHVGRRRISGVLVDPETQQARALLVRRSRRRAQVVAASTVTAVDPFRRVVHLAPPRRRRPSRTPRAARRPRPIVAVGARTRAATSSAARGGAVLAIGALDRLRPLAAAYAHDVRVALTLLARAYAHNAAVVISAWIAALREASLRPPWTPSSPPSWTRRAPRSPAARRRMPGR